VLVHPVFFGSALTGAGVDAVMTGIAELLRPRGRPGRSTLGLCVQDRASAQREKVAYVRMFSGTIARATA
jgi:ribosomal protection tetracycline resistance protein